MIIEHRSTRDDLEFLRPQSGVFDGNGAEKKRYHQDPDRYLPRWYGTVAGFEPEPRIRSRPYLYTAIVDADSIYDLKEDPLDINSIPDVTDREIAIKDAGYSGYRVGGVVAVFIATPCYKEKNR